MYGAAFLAAPRAAVAQQAGKVYRVGLIATTSPVSEMAGPEPIHPSIRAFVHGLRALGYVEGQNLILERRSAEGQFERFGDIVAELVREALPGVSRVAYLGSKQEKDWEGPWGHSVRTAAQALGVTLVLA